MIHGSTLLGLGILMALAFAWVLCRAAADSDDRAGRLIRDEMARRRAGKGPS